MAARPKAGTSKAGSPKAELSRAEQLARKLAKVAPQEDPALVAAAIVIFATENIRRSADDLKSARAYLEGMRGAIDELLRGAFPPQPADKTIEVKTKRRAPS
jgi:hypothetical protein